MAFGQPAWSWVLGLVASCMGYALFWNVLLDYPSWKKRFWLSTAWFTGVQLVQLSWMVSHPFLYILLPYVALSFLWGLQFGLIGILITPTAIKSLRKIVGISALWMICEWSRLFFLSGFSWNMSGLALASSIYSLQAASLGGVFALSFWVFLVNFLALRKSYFLFACCAALPFIFGAFHYHVHQKAMQNNSSTMTVVLVQPSFPCEATLNGTPQEMVQCVTDQWQKILTLIKKHHGRQIDLIVLPEYFVPFGTYTFIFEYDQVRKAFADVYGDEMTAHLPKLEHHLAYRQGKKWLVNNAYWMQAIANLFNSSVIGGMEDVEDNTSGQREHFSSAQYFVPRGDMPKRYDKRVLVPLGEYIPFEFLRNLAASYGVHGSFVLGQHARIFEHDKFKFGTSICYEETFGDMMSENRKAGADLLVNLSNDAWFPQSRLAHQHFEHSRLRTVENGIPLIRACNTGVTTAVDSLGRTIAILGADHPDLESLSDSLLVHVPVYTYQTFYSKYGDTPVVLLAFAFLLLLL